MVFYMILENTIIGLIDGKVLAGRLSVLIRQGSCEWIAGSLVTIFAFIPFFAVKEFGRVMGESKLDEIFFRIRLAKEINSDTASG